MLNIINKLFGYRWSLYLATKDKVLYYAMHSDNVYLLLIRVADFFLEKGNPEEPWRVYLNFNKKHKEILLSKEYFKNEGIKIKEELLEKIKDIDPNYENYIGINEKPVFKDLQQNKYLKISPIDFKDPSTIKNLLSGEQKEKTAMDVLNEIFNS